jgi:chromosome segregation protein
MDEVEAALDDANLQRFLALIDDFRNDAQLIIVSHQKRTMEVADALYGISMQPGGASKVVSERLRRSGLAQTPPVPVPLASGSMPPAGP